MLWVLHTSSRRTRVGPRHLGPVHPEGCDGWVGGSISPEGGQRETIEFILGIKRVAIPAKDNTVGQRRRWRGYDDERVAFSAVHPSEAVARTIALL
ncbi:hypothetical protein FA13DRAFT_1140117 [Coprinellus micaceus]|uniref:Uncharacterized protein n=1 Tax=Coprinellus micaceus TaxID=71717 RepID=A0A4Y7SVQ1_COPMI|nr:hypothetical protein FA13DRAFT_1140117 [Coprinellus micaceus]